ncbi:ankyrin repeat domain-containing protein [Belnapia sp. T18]|uniref:Ankyrin repeat domain-containing protein n=1 Tax=Belnapia arida TaxID=2804533 RepID=A0ABS1TXF4_9PROT|nr:ankyrin repeat domain-containing protein [Belnapia arida]MBL6076540.1 ankyrin repeat domain-containing protein [Belnapia arida]
MRSPALFPPLALAALFALPIPEAAAQFGRGGRAGGLTDAPTEASRPPPAALPGLQYRRAPEPIPADPGQNLGPNAALFDAINRGDIAAAREAVGRGADIGSRNVLGLSPIDAAVDQGRSEILFFLLSVRGSSGSQGAPLPPTEPVTPAVAPRPAPRRNAAPAAERPVANPVQRVANPRLWAGDGGSPNPAIGFLGFDAGRPAGAAPPEAAAGPAPRRNGRG